MPPNKGGNAKKEAGRAKKAENEVCPLVCESLYRSGCGRAACVLKKAGQLVLRASRVTVFHWQQMTSAGRATVNLAR